MTTEILQYKNCTVLKNNNDYQILWSRGKEMLNFPISQELAERVSKSEKDSLEVMFYYVTTSPSRSARCETNKPPAMRVRIEGYTKKLQTRYNKGVQANCKAKGEKYGTKGT